MRDRDEGATSTRAEVGSAPRDVQRAALRDYTEELIERFAGAAAEERRAIRDEVVTLHLGLAASAARRYGSYIEHDDLVQVARVGLVEAFDRYDPAQSSYASFAWVTMTGLLRRHLRDHGWSVRPPRSAQVAANMVRAARPGLAQELGRSPSTADLAAHLGWSTTAVDNALQAELGLSATSIDALVGDGWEPEHPNESHHLVEVRATLASALGTLSDDERLLIQMRFVEEMAQSKIAALHGVPQMQISRRLTRLMAKLRSEIAP